MLKIDSITSHLPVIRPQSAASASGFATPHNWLFGKVALSFAKTPAD
jgi:hypothetical protein